MFIANIVDELSQSYGRTFPPIVSRVAGKETAIVRWSAIVVISFCCLVWDGNLEIVSCTYNTGGAGADAHSTETLLLCIPGGDSICGVLLTAHRNTLEYTVTP